MATYNPDRVHASQDSGNDPFHDPVIVGIGITVVVVTLVMLAMGGVYYWGELYGAPSRSANSYSPAVIY